MIAGDMATARAPGRYALVYLVYNEISALLSQGEQVACFRNAALHLTAGGRFVIELWVPAIRVGIRESRSRTSRGWCRR